MYTLKGTGSRSDPRWGGGDLVEDKLGSSNHLHKGREARCKHGPMCRIRWYRVPTREKKGQMTSQVEQMVEVDPTPDIGEPLCISMPKGHVVQVQSVYNPYVEIYLNQTSNNIL